MESPHEPGARALVLAWEEAGDLPAAITEYDMAIRLSLHGWGAHVQRGAVQAKRGRWADAAADYRRAFELAPADWPRRAEVDERARQAEAMVNETR